MAKDRARDSKRTIKIDNSLQKMGSSLGWSSYGTTGGRSIANPDVNDNALSPGIGKGHVTVRGENPTVPDKFKGTRGVGGKY